MVAELIMKYSKEYGSMAVLDLQKSGPTTTFLSKSCPTKLLTVLLGEYRINCDDS